MDSTPVIRLDGLSRNFGKVEAVRGVSFEVLPGEIFGIVGPDGAGKSTLLRMLAGILTPSAGDAWVCGLSVCSDSDLIKDRIAYVSQQFGLYTDLSVKENIDFYADLYGVARKGRAARIDELLDFSNMRPFKRRLAGKLSGGMKQKLQLVCALIHTPEVLLLDEPTNGVDPVSRRDFWRILYRLAKQGTSICVSTAYLDEAERMSRLALLHQGKLFALGTPAEIKALVGGKQAGADARPTVAPSLEEVFISLVGGNGGRGRAPHRPVLDARVARASSPRSRLVQGGQDARPTKRVRRPAPTEEHGIAQQPAVSVQDLTRKFGSFTAVDRINFEVGKGEIFGFLGPNGAGKSTTIRMLCGLLMPSAGEGSVAGLNIWNEQEAIKQRIGYMSQKFSLYGDLTVEENIEFFGGVYGLKRNELRARMDWAVEMAGLAEHRSTLTSNLAAGWKQRLALGCAILHEPPILFLDEPTSGVDPISRRNFWSLIYELAGRGVTVFVTTHYMDEAEYCDRVALIYHGQLIALGTPSELKRERMQGGLLSIKCDRVQDALELVEGVPGIQDVALFGGGLHARTADPLAAAGAVRLALADAGYVVEQVQEITPSLEDVFVALIEEFDRAAQVEGGKHA